MKRIAGTVLALLAASASFSASALGLGQIEVKSKIGQPLVAEIPIVTSDPSELEQLQAGLASPETFSRIGLRPPIGIIADLQFTQALDARGNPIIRVTSTQPVSEPLLTFLVEVDWGQGRLVREYSALVDTPRTVSAPLQPEVTAPTVEAPAVIERPAEPSETVATEAKPEPSPTEQTDATKEPAPQDTQAIAPTPVAPQPQVASTPISRPAPDGSDYEVRGGDTLSAIATRVGGAGTLDQTMIALLRANPDAFIDGNINRLKAGAVLRMPGGDAMTELDAQQARAIVHTQIQEWRASRRAAPQPADADATASAAAPIQGRTTSTLTSTSKGQRVADARLEIVPPGASDATKAGTQSGISAGGEGAMLQQELTQTKETLAAREAEAEDLKSRVAELEKLQQQQQQLLTMKDSELAAAQQRLAQTQKQPPQGSVMPWAFGIGGALVLGALIGWFVRRRDKATPSFRTPKAASPSIADAFAPRSDTARDEEQADEVEAMAEPVPVAAAPAFAPAPAPAPAPSVRAVPAWHTGAATQRDLLDPAAPGAHERLELARAYLDLGDLAGARQLLGEVVINGDHTARQQAARMLRELE